MINLHACSGNRNVVANRRGKLMFLDFFYFCIKILYNPIICELFDMKVVKNWLSLKIFKLLSFQGDQEKTNIPV